MNDSNFENTGFDAGAVNNVADAYSYDATAYDVQPVQGKGLAIASMVIGIASLVIGLVLSCCFGGFTAVVPFITSIPGIILGIIGLKKGQSKGMCVAGIICSAIALVFSVVMFILACIGLAYLTSTGYY